MYDSWEYTIPANTSEADRVRVPCKISPGTLTELVFHFPTGCHRLARCRVLIGEKPVAPRSSASYVAGNMWPIIIPDMHEAITGNRPVLNWEIWNVDEEMDHTIALDATWTAEEELQAERSLLALIAQRIDALVRALTGGA